MVEKNLFIGIGLNATFARASYQLLMTGSWISYQDIASKVLTSKKYVDDKGHLKYGITKFDEYETLKQVFPKLCKLIDKRCGTKAIETCGNNRNKQYRYSKKADNPDPLGDMLRYSVVKSLEDYWSFCQESAGFFPISWLEYFFEDCQDLLNMKKKRNEGEQILEVSIDRILKNIDKLPLLHHAIKNQQVLKFEYHPFDDQSYELIIHPHYLKEYNGRWFLLGEANRPPFHAFNVALDRISSEIEVVEGMDYIPAEKGFYRNRFKDIVGVIYYDDVPVETIVFRTKTKYIHGLLVTKPLHPSQKELLPFSPNQPEGSYGVLSLSVKPNPELLARLLSLGNGIEVVQPDGVRNQMKNIVSELYQTYFPSKPD